MKKIALILSLISLPIHAENNTPIFDPYSGWLVMSEVDSLDGQTFYDVIIELKSNGTFEVLAASTTPPSSGSNGGIISDVCTTEMITSSKVVELDPFISLEEANEIIGCYGEKKAESASGGLVIALYEWSVDNVYRLPRITSSFTNGQAGTFLYYGL